MINLYADITAPGPAVSFSVVRSCAALTLTKTKLYHTTNLLYDEGKIPPNLITQDYLLFI